MSARFKVLLHEAPCIVIEDLGPWDRFKTITNAADQVVAEMMLTSGQRLFYVDSQGQLDELLIRGGRFAGFQSGGATHLGRRLRLMLQAGELQEFEGGGQ